MNIYLNFSGEAQEALDFYSKVFKTKAYEITHYEDAPSQDDQPLPESFKGKIMHSIIEIDGQKVMVADYPEEMGVKIAKGNNISLVVNPGTILDAKKIFASLSDGAEVTVDLEETFWADAYGQLVDKFGISWMLNVPKQVQFGE